MRGTQECFLRFFTLITLFLNIIWFYFSAGGLVVVSLRGSFFLLFMSSSFHHQKWAGKHKTHLPSNKFYSKKWFTFTTGLKINFPLNISHSLLPFSSFHSMFVHFVFILNLILSSPYFSFSFSPHTSRVCIYMWIYIFLGDIDILFCFILLLWPEILNFFLILVFLPLVRGCSLFYSSETFFLHIDVYLSFFDI